MIEKLGVQLKRYPGNEYSTPCLCLRSEQAVLAYTAEIRVFHCKTRVRFDAGQIKTSIRKYILDANL